MNHNNVKFRPVLSLSQIRHITAILTSETDSVSKSIIRVMVPMIAKIEVGAINPAYKLSEIHQAKQIEKSEAARYNNGEMSDSEESEYESKIMGI